MNRWPHRTTKQKVFQVCKFTFWLMAILLVGVGIAAIWGAAGPIPERLAGTFAVIGVLSVFGLIATEEM